ncbi:MAG TPA: hypothetical protein VGI23_17065 [Steroidobacteraceae bacterium]|jgi:hypothetical protein
METVYRFEIWDRETRTTSFAEHMGTREAIRRLRGEADLSSAKVVQLGEVDSAGFYREATTSMGLKES